MIQVMKWKDQNMSSIDNTAIKLEPQWLEALEGEFDQDYMVKLRQFLQAERSAGKIIYPKGGEYFAAFNHTPLDKVKVVILGQDPYHGPGQAHGLCFSVQSGVTIPPSLVNIYKELADDLDIAPASHGCLTSWADQGVLLLNSVLTVEQAEAASHQGKGWETFTDRAIDVINRQREGIVFMLWGGYAQKKGAIIDGDKHLVLKSPHPSPLSSYRGFFGCKHFSQANAYLQQRGLESINWQLPDLTETDSID